MRREFLEKIEASPIIAAVKDDRELARALQSDVDVVFILYVPNVRGQFLFYRLNRMIVPAIKIKYFMYIHTAGEIPPNAWIITLREEHKLFSCRLHVKGNLVLCHCFAINLLLHKGSS
jgi:hypothetical protein